MVSLPCERCGLRPVQGPLHRALSGGQKTSPDEELQNMLFEGKHLQGRLKGELIQKFLQKPQEAWETEMCGVEEAAAAAPLRPSGHFSTRNRLDLYSPQEAGWQTGTAPRHRALSFLHLCHPDTPGP